MFAERRENRLAIERALRELEKLQRGSMFSHEDATRALGVGPPSDRYYDLMGRIKNKLLKDRGIALECVPEEGYTLCLPKAQCEAARTQHIRGTRRIRKGYQIVSSLPDDECDAEVRKAKFGIEERLSHLEHEMRRQSQLMSFLLRPRERLCKPCDCDDKERESA